MTGLAILDVAIGLVFVYLLLSMLCTIVNEMISQAFSWRSKTLRTGIGELLADPDLQGLANAVCEHPLIKSCGKKGKMPSYVSSATFARTLIDVIEKSDEAKKTATGTIGSLQSALKNYEDTDAGKALLVLVGRAGTTLDDATKEIEQWFDDGMDRVSGWYKRKKQVTSLLIAVVIAVSLNANSFVIAKAIWHEPKLRQTLVESAKEFSNKCKKQDVSACANFKKVQTELRPLPIGWSEPDGTSWAQKEWKLSILGWLITALAISMGAPFWFDVLNKFNSIRMTGKKPKTSAEKRAGATA